MKLSADIVIVGSGVGGGTLASALAGSGAHVLILERGKHLPREDENWNADAVFNQGRYATRENWKDDRGKPYGANAYYHVGGASKMFGAAMFRFRERDFGAFETADGVSPAWPISYADLEPFYFRAEKLFGVRGVVGEDPTEPWRSSPFPHPAVQHNDHLERGVVEALRRQGLSPAHLPLAIDEGASGSCQRCATCDAYPCRVGAKGDAERRTIEPALQSGNVQLLTNARVRRIIAAPSGRSIVALEVMLAGEMATVNAAIFVVAAGAINSAKLLLASDHPRHSRGIANSAGHVGRNLMLHVSSAMVAVNPRQLEPIPFQKTLAINDFYFGRDGGDPPLGSVQTLGKLNDASLRAGARWMPRIAAGWLLKRSIEWWLMTEDFPDRSNQVSIDGSSLKIRYKPNNTMAHRRLVKRWASVMRSIGRPLTLSRAAGRASTSHQCGTVRFGRTPDEAALDSFCRTFDHTNLFVVDASFFPSSAALNPALTIAAQALRVADHIVGLKLNEQVHRISTPESATTATPGE
jgi:choline dehydrogenase-like flavoprotein